jgi:hypothetical protein
MRESLDAFENDEEEFAHGKSAAARLRSTAACGPRGTKTSPMFANVPCDQRTKTRTSDQRRHDPSTPHAAVERTRAAADFPGADLFSSSKQKRLNFRSRVLIAIAAHPSATEHRAVALRESAPAAAQNYRVVVADKDSTATRRPEKQY